MFVWLSAHMQSDNPRPHPRREGILLFNLLACAVVMDRFSIRLV